MFFRYTRWTRQPQYPVGIDRSHPSVRALYSAVNMAGVPYESTQRGLPVPLTTVTKALNAGLHGSIGTFDVEPAANGQVYTSTGWRYETGSGDFSILIVSQLIGSSSATYYSAQSTFGNAILVGQSSYVPYIEIGGLNNLTFSGYSPTAGDVLACIFSYTYNSSTTLTGYNLTKNVAFTETKASAGVPYGGWGDATYNSITVGGGFKQTPSVPVFLDARWRRRVEGAEAREIIANPWQLFAP